MKLRMTSLFFHHQTGSWALKISFTTSFINLRDFFLVIKFDDKICNLGSQPQLMKYKKGFLSGMMKTKAMTDRFFAPRIVLPRTISERAHSFSATLQVVILHKIERETDSAECAVINDPSACKAIVMENKTCSSQVGGKVTFATRDSV
jgi:hypothetical protein